MTSGLRRRGGGRAALGVPLTEKGNLTMSKVETRLRRLYQELAEAAKALADKVDATSDCDHKRASCADVGCIGVEVKRVREALQKE